VTHNEPPLDVFPFRGRHENLKLRPNLWRSVHGDVFPPVAAVSRPDNDRVNFRVLGQKSLSLSSHCLIRFKVGRNTRDVECTSRPSVRKLAQQVIEPVGSATARVPAVRDAYGFPAAIFDFRENGH